MLTGANSEKNNGISYWADVRLYSFKALLIFFLSTVIFIDITSDIESYISDHYIGSNYNVWEIAVILVFLVFFYVVSISLIKLYERASHKKFIDNKWCHLLLRIICAFVFIAYILGVVFPMHNGSIYNPEREGLWWIVFWWLLSILIINILLEHGPLDGVISKIIEAIWTPISKKLKNCRFLRRYIYE
jgi:hypothetical protein